MLSHTLYVFLLDVVVYLLFLCIDYYKERWYWTADFLFRVIFSRILYVRLNISLVRILCTEELTTLDVTEFDKENNRFSELILIRFEISHFLIPFCTSVKDILRQIFPNQNARKCICMKVRQFSSSFSSHILERIQ